jgi:hypothetical protein
MEAEEAMQPAAEAQGMQRAGAEAIMRRVVPIVRPVADTPIRALVTETAMRT